jgi:hypothetical protein
MDGIFAMISGHSAEFVQDKFFPGSVGTQIALSDGFQKFTFGFGCH